MTAGLTPPRSPRVCFVARNWMTLLLSRTASFCLIAVFLRCAGATLPSAELGEFFVLVAWFGVLSLLATTGLLPLLLRTIAESSEASEPVLGASIRHALGRARWASGAFAVAATLVHGSVQPGLLVAAAALLLTPLQLAAAPSLRTGRTRDLASAELLGRGTGLLLGATAALAWPSVGAFVCAHAVGSIVPGIRLAWALPAAERQRLLRPARQKKPRPTRSELIVASGDVVRALYFQGAPWIAALLVGAQHAPFSAALRLLAIAAMVPATLNTTLLGPLLVKAPRVPMLRVLVAAAALGGALAACISLPAPTWIGFLFPKLSDAATAVACARVLACAAPFLFASGMCIPLLFAQHDETMVLCASLAGLTTFVAVSSSLRATAGPVALAWGLLACEVVVCAICVVTRLAYVRTTRTEAATASGRSLGPCPIDRCA